MTRTDFILRTLCDAGHKEHKQIFVDLYKFTEQEAQEMETPPLKHQSEIRHFLIYVSRSIQSDSKPFATVLAVWCLLLQSKEYSNPAFEVGDEGGNTATPVPGTEDEAEKTNGKFRGTFE